MKKIFIFLFISTSIFADFNATKSEIEDISQNFRKKTTKNYHHLLYGVDSYFNKTNDINRSSYRKIRNNKLQIILSVKEGPRLNAHFRGKIVLPQLKNKAELTFSQNDDQEIDNQSVVSQNDDVVSDSKLRVGLKYYLYRDKKSIAYAKVSLKVSSPFGPYLKLGMDKSYLSDDFLETTFNHAIYYYPNGNDVSASTAVSFFNPLSNIYWVGQGNKLYWEGENNLYLSNNLLFYHIFDLNNRMVYKVSFTTSYNSAEQFAHDGFSFSTGYFHRFDKWFFIEAIPKFRKQRENGYKDEILFTLNFGMLLGR